MMKTKIYFNLLHHNVFSFINVTDIVNKALLHFRTSARVRVRATVKLSAAFFCDESSITVGGYESAMAPSINSTKCF